MSNEALQATAKTGPRAPTVRRRRQLGGGERKIVSLGDPHSNVSRGLLLWYALFQIAHSVLNGLYLVSPGAPPFAPPPEGWVPQAVAFLNGMAALDFVNAVLSVIFVVGFLRRAPWSVWLGTVTLTVSIYAAAVFTWGIVQAGAWRGLGSEYLWVNVPFVPVVILFAAWSYWAASGKLASVPAVVGAPSNQPLQPASGA